MIPQSLIRKHHRFVLANFTRGLSKKEERAWRGVLRRMDDYELASTNTYVRRQHRQMRKMRWLRRIMKMVLKRNRRKT